LNYGGERLVDDHHILLTFYGDDFTGTTATAEALFDSETPTVIFTDPPDLTFLADCFPNVRAVGIAGTARTLAAEELEHALGSIFLKIKSHRSPIIMYKICSTFDSSEKIGSIGKAIEIGKSVFSSDLVPVLAAAPRLGRYTVFGHHFAALGQGEVYRLDRHPSMMNHPVTPMRESDLRLHLAQQTSLRSSLINILDLRQGKAHVRNLLSKLREDGTQIVFFDCLYEHHLRLACEVIWEQASPQNPLFCVGAQELGYGFAATWEKYGLLRTEGQKEEAVEIPQKPIFVLSGSCATVTGKQIQWSAENGFANIDIRPQKLIDPSSRQLQQERVVASCLEEIQHGMSVVAHTAVGPEDIRIGTLRKKARDLALPYDEANRILGDALGEIALEVLQQSLVKRCVVSGGDTAGRIQKHLVIRALQIAKPIGIAAPLCYVYSNKAVLNGMEMAFKGGQIGSVDYFGQVQAAATRGFENELLGSFPNT
jgi:uncharacterized protein YgbK (DUF1537 family)